MNINQINKKQAVITTQEVIEGSSSIMLVVVDEDGDLQFIGKSGVSEEMAKVVSLEQILVLDPSFRWIDDLRIDTRYERTSQGWTPKN